MRKAINIDELPAGGPVDAYGFPILPAGTVQTEADVPIQRILGGYMAVPGMAGWFTREMTLRQEIELVDMAEEMQALAAEKNPKPSKLLKAALPIARLILFRRNADGDMTAASEDDILDSFKAAQLMDVVKEIAGFGVQESGDSPTPAPSITGSSSAG